MRMLMLISTQAHTPLPSRKQHTQCDARHRKNVPNAGTSVSSTFPCSSRNRRTLPAFRKADTKPFRSILYFNVAFSPGTCRTQT